MEEKLPYEKPIALFQYNYERKNIFSLQKIVAFCSAYKKITQNNLDDFFTMLIFLSLRIPSQILRIF